MKWNIYCIGHDFTRDIEQIVALFFEDPTLIFHRIEQKDINEIAKPAMAIAMEYGEEVTVGIQLFPPKGDQTYSISHGEKVEEEDGVARRKHCKRVMNKGLLKVLEHYAGMVQPWGILTGIRPTKLMHTLVQEGKKSEEARHILREERLVTPEKIDLLQQIVDRQLKVLPDLYQLNEKEVSIYIGIPFCPTKCAYCTFPAYSIQGQRKLIDPFIALLKEEIKLVGEYLN
ncbi:MAG TPA: coproporphyrinogen III oxidase, partial [Paenibacillaceae bacterium]|nr:coproporphyrinogen III oxidase [Paenibacillaceae bacterium]